MGQVLHIFRKDTRRFWPEILVSLAVLLAFLAVTPRLWPYDRLNGINHFAQQLSMVLNFLLPVSWWLLLARCVHAESLVGENQAWLTRPFRWPELLTAKALFALVYLWLPLWIAQCVLLHLAGFAVIPFAGDLFYDTCLIAAFIVLPLFAIATLTANFARMTLTLLGVLLGLIGMMTLGAWRHSNEVTIPFQPSHLNVLLWPWLALLIAAIVLQYKRRQAAWARALLLVPLVTGGLFVALHVTAPDVDGVYPKAAAPLLKVDFAPTEKMQTLAYQQPYGKREQIEIHLPVVISGVPDGTATKLDLYQVTLDAGSVHWESKWLSTYGYYVPGEEPGRLRVLINRDVYDGLRGQKVDLHLTFALSGLRAGDSSERVIGAREFAIPYDGICSLQQGNGERSLSELHCRYPLRGSPITYVTAPGTTGVCNGSATGSKITAHDWAGPRFSGQRQFDFGFSPVHTLDEVFYFQRDEEESNFTGGRLCPGTSVSFTDYYPAGRARATLDIPALVLPSKVSGE